MSDLTLCCQGLPTGAPSRRPLELATSSIVKSHTDGGDVATATLSPRVHPEVVTMTLFTTELVLFSIRVRKLLVLETSPDSSATQKRTFAWRHRAVVAGTRTLGGVGHIFVLLFTTDLVLGGKKKMGRWVPKTCI